MRIVIVGAVILALAAGEVSGHPTGYGAGAEKDDENHALAMSHMDHSVDPASTPTEVPRTLAAAADIEGAPASAGKDSPAARLNRDFHHAIQADDRDENEDAAWSWSFAERDRERDVIAGCPPGLTNRGKGCTPAGPISDRGALGYTYQPSLFGLTHYAAGRYFYDDGYLIRLADSGAIDGYIPLLGGALAVGSAWPESYPGYTVPGYYEDLYDPGLVKIPLNGSFC